MPPAEQILPGASIPDSLLQNHVGSPCRSTVFLSGNEIIYEHSFEGASSLVQVLSHSIFAMNMCSNTSRSNTTVICGRGVATNVVAKGKKNASKVAVTLKGVSKQLAGGRQLFNVSSSNLWTVRK